MPSVLSRGLIGILAVVAATSLVFAEEAATVVKGKTIKMDYTLNVDGKEIDTTVGKNPIEFVQGEGTIILGLSKAIEGMKVGEQKSITVVPEEGYGAVDPKALIEVPRSILPSGMEPKVGMIVEVQGAEGQAFPATIWEFKEEKVVLNFNHPLAGKELKFDVKIVAVE